MKRLLVALLGTVVLGAALATSLDEGKDAFARKEWKPAATLLSRFLQESPDDPQAPTAAFLRGVALYQAGDFRGSLDAFQKLDRTWPQSEFSQRLPYWKGTAALAAGQSALAERELLAQARYPEQEPFTTRALLNLALARVAQGKSGPALEALAAFTAANREPELASQAWATWGDEDRKAGRVDEALLHYRKAWLAHPGDRWDLWARTQALDLYLSLGRFQESSVLLEASAAAFAAETERWDTRRIEVARGLGDLPALARALETRWSRVSDPRKKQDLAVNRARTAEDLGQSDPLWWLRASIGPDETLGAQAILRHAFLLETANPSAAAQALDDWAAAHRSAPAAAREEVRSRAAQNRWVAGDSVGARRGWDRLIADFPKSARLPGWLLGRGRLALEAGETTPALADMSRVLKEFPKATEAPEARYQTGLVYLKRQEPARAEAWFFGLVQELKSGDLYERALLARGISFVNSGQTDLARGSLERLLREVPQGVWTGAAWAALGRNALQSRLFAEAADAFARAEQTQTEAVERAKALWSFAEARAGQGRAAEAAQAFGRYVADYAEQPRVAEALYRRGAVWFSALNWQAALEAWSAVVGTVRGEWLAMTREGMATALLRLGRVEEGWSQLETLEAALPSPEAWYRWGQAATALGQADWAVKAFQVLLQRHPQSAVAEAALPRAAGALLGGGQSEEALARYADYFRKFGRQASSAPVARAAASAALAFPATLEALVTQARTWGLAPEVEVEFSLVWAQSRLDSDPEHAVAELQALSRTAPWTSQRSEALAVLGRWHLGHGRLGEARTVLEAAAGLGDELSVLKARWALAQVTEKEGDRSNAARLRESAEKAAGPAVPLEFRIRILQEAVDTWTAAAKPDEAQRVQRRISALER